MNIADEKNVLCLRICLWTSVLRKKNATEFALNWNFYKLSKSANNFFLIGDFIHNGSEIVPYNKLLRLF